MRLANIFGLTVATVLAYVNAADIVGYKFEDKNTTPSYENENVVFLCISGDQVQGMFGYRGFVSGTYDSESKRITNIQTWDIDNNDVTMNDMEITATSLTTVGGGSLSPFSSYSSISRDTSAEVDPRENCAFSTVTSDDASVAGYYQSSLGNAGYFCLDENTSGFTSSYRALYEEQYLTAQVGDIELGVFNGARIQGFNDAAIRGTWSVTRGPIRPLSGKEMHKLDSINPTDVVLTGLYCTYDDQGIIAECVPNIYPRASKAAPTAQECAAFPVTGFTSVKFTRTSNECPENWAMDYPLCGTSFHCIDHDANVLQGTIGGYILFEGTVNPVTRVASVNYIMGNQTKGAATWTYSADYMDIMVQSSDHAIGDLGYGVSGGGQKIPECAWGVVGDGGSLANKWMGVVETDYICEGGTKFTGTYQYTWPTDDEDGPKGTIERGTLDFAKFQNGLAGAGFWTAVSGPAKGTHGTQMYRANYGNSIVPSLSGMWCEHPNDDTSKPPSFCEFIGGQSRNDVFGTSVCSSFPTTSSNKELQEKVDKREHLAIGFGVIALLLLLATIVFLVMWIRQRSQAKADFSTSNSSFVKNPVDHNAVAAYQA